MIGKSWIDSLTHYDYRGISVNGLIPASKGPDHLQGANDINAQPNYRFGFTVLHRQVTNVSVIVDGPSLAKGNNGCHIVTVQFQNRQAPNVIKVPRVSFFGSMLTDIYDPNTVGVSERS